MPDSVSPTNSTVNSQLIPSADLNLIREGLVNPAMAAAGSVELETVLRNIITAFNNYVTQKG